MNHDGFEVFMLQFIINIAPDVGKEQKIKDRGNDRIEMPIYGS